VLIASVKNSFTDNSVRGKPYSALVSSEVKLCSGLLTSNDSQNAKEFVSVFQQRCEHKASHCNKSYRLPEIEHALWFMSLRTLKRFKRAHLLM